MNDLQPVFDMFYHAVGAQERTWMARVSTEEALEAVLGQFAAQLREQAAEPLSRSRAAGHSPAELRICICFDNTAARTGEDSGIGVYSRIDLYDAAGSPLPLAAFGILSLHLRGMSILTAGTPERTQLMREWAKRVASMVTTECERLEGLRAAPRIYSGSAWDLTLRRWQGSDSDVLQFRNIESLDAFFTASLERT